MMHDWPQWSRFQTLSAATIERGSFMVFQKQLTRRTKGHGEMHNLTDEVGQLVAKSGIQDGLAQVFVVGSTAAIGTIEFEPGLRKDLPGLLDRLIPASSGQGHEQTWHDGNGHSHLQATLLGPSLTVPVAGGRPVLGTWQQVFLLECDIVPRDRTIVVTVMGE
ncbi:MAG TPA: secondary thiamine-phosphate synthase enzyme YjbQ [Isosphaeraceae bacterium]|jgi:secondary thiamine-phosphate synthase enzyme|nr:secondary thiamine-phosphate synthase enzyme YjbQ [Isosphaeraceae bacterium]